MRFASVLGPFKEMTPPRLGAMNRDLLTLGRLGLKINYPAGGPVLSSTQAARRGEAASPLA